MLLGLAAAIMFKRLDPVAALGFSGLIGVAIGVSRYEHPRSWWPTGITAFRFTVTAALAAFGAFLPGLLIVGVVTSVLVLDRLDGELARRTNSVSALGGHLDTEADGFLSAVVCLLLWLEYGLPVWVLTAGLLRYCYVLLVRWVPSRGLVPRSRFAARVFGIALVGLMMGFLKLGVLSMAGPALATVLLCWSFARSFYWSFTGDALRASS